MRQSVNAKASLTARMTVRAVTKVGVSDPAVCEWKCRRSTDKSYPGDNRLISPKSPHRRGGLALDVGSSHPGAESYSKGLAVRQLKRYASWVQNVVETVPILSVVGVGYLQGAVPSTRGPGWTHLWCTSCHASGTAGQLCAERINAEGI